MTRIYLVRHGTTDWNKEEIFRGRKHKFQLVAMATHGRSGLSRWALGSVADKVLTCSQVPVMLVRVS